MSLIELEEIEERMLIIIAGEKALKGSQEKGGKPLISAEVAFQLYDTYGFPLDLTSMICKERGWELDAKGAETLMEDQKLRGKASWNKSHQHSSIEGSGPF